MGWRYGLWSRYVITGIIKEWDKLKIHSCCFISALRRKIKKINLDGAIFVTIMDILIYLVHVHLVRENMIDFIWKCVRLSEAATRIDLPSQNTTRDIIKVLMDSMIIDIRIYRWRKDQTSNCLVFIV